jgi:hypothetical protein
VPSRLADAWASQDTAWQRPVNEATDKALAALAGPAGPLGTAAVGLRGLPQGRGHGRRAWTPANCRPKPWNRRQPGLYFIGEVVDVTGWLGGYNFQWAWASGHACAMALPGPATPAA